MDGNETRKSDTVDPDSQLLAGRTHRPAPGEKHRLVTDGGESDEEDETEEAAESEDEGSDGEMSTEADSDDAAEDEQEAQEEEESQEDESEKEESQEDESEKEESEEEPEPAEILHLDLEGLFLNVLGLEVDLDEVILDVSARPGSNRLLGNLLSAVSGLLDSGPLSMLGSVKNKIAGLFSFGDGESGGIRSSIADSIRSAGRSLLERIPFEKMIAGLVREIASQVLEKSDSDLLEDTAESVTEAASGSESGQEQEASS